MKARVALFAALPVCLLLATQISAREIRVVVRSGQAQAGHFHGRFVHPQPFHPGFRGQGLHVTFGSPPFHPHPFGHHQHFRHELLFGPHHHLGFHGSPHTVVISSPFFCHPHSLGFVTQAGFLDHLHGVHRISLDSGLSFCDRTGSSCAFLGY